MKIWDELNDGLKESTRTWADWARRNAKELGDAGIRHVERQDLLTERRRTVSHLGEQVANRFLLEEKKMVRVDSPGIAELVQRLEQIDARLLQIRESEKKPE